MRRWLHRRDILILAMLPIMVATLAANAQVNNQTIPIEEFQPTHQYTSFFEIAPNAAQVTAREYVQAPGFSQPPALSAQTLARTVEPEVPPQVTSAMPAAVSLIEPLTESPAETHIASHTTPHLEPSADSYTEVPTAVGSPTNLGFFTVTAYCACPKCCGKWSGQKMSIATQSGNPYPVEGYTASVDPDIIPLKSTIEIEGVGERYAHDTGSAIKGKRIDLFFASHEAALSFGKKELEVWIYQ